MLAGAWHVSDHRSSHEREEAMHSRTARCGLHAHTLLGESDTTTRAGRVELMCR